MVRAWYMPENELVNSQFEENFISELSMDRLLNEIGVAYYHVNADDLENDPTFNHVIKTMGITYRDQIIISPEKFPNYDEKLKIFYAEHLHADDEIRLVLDGSGYFDIRDPANKWVRIQVVKGDLITLPAGAYHRFTTDQKHFIHAMRLFVGDPVWTPLNRPADDHVSRADYLKKFPPFALDKQI